jgi:hypothetical protein
MIGDDDCVAVKGMNEFRRKLALVQLRPPHIHRDLARARIRTDAGGSQLLNACGTHGLNLVLSTE